MRYRTYGFAISFLAHAAGIFLLLTFCRFVPVESKTLVIDFTTFSVSRPAPAPARAAAPARPKSIAPPVPEEKKVPEMPPVPIARIKPAKSKTKVIRPQPADKAVELPLEAEPAVAAEETEPAPDPAPSRAADTSENVSAREAGGPIATDGAAATDARPGAMGKKEYLKAHFLYIKENIQKNIIYPRLARKMGWEGKVVVSFVICEDGTVSDIKIVKSSGFTLLDKNALEAIKKSVPFPSPPVRAELVVPVSYRLS